MLTGILLHEVRVGDRPYLARPIFDKHRLLVAISFNSDIGDSWEWMDSPDYPEKYSALGIRIGINNIVYAMTH